LASQLTKLIVFKGKNLFPGTGIVTLIWKNFAFMKGMDLEKCPVTLEDVEFLRATSLMKNREFIFSVSIHRGKSERPFNSDRRVDET
jgi:fatty acid synthase, animal type